MGRKGEGLLYRNTGADAFATPRSWAQAARLLAVSPPKMLPQLLCACVGPTATEQYLQWQRVASQCDPTVILVNGRMPNLTKGPLADPSLKQALLFAVGDMLEQTDPLPPKWLDRMAQLMQAPGMDPELVVLGWRHLSQATQGKLAATPKFSSVAAMLTDLTLAALESPDE